MSDTPLTADAVAALPDNTPIVVIWSGGNMPHYYFKTDWYGYPVAATAWEIEHNRLDIVGKRLGVWPKGFVGQETYHTRVWTVLDILHTYYTNP